MAILTPEQLTERLATLAARDPALAGLAVEAYSGACAIGPHLSVRIVRGWPHPEVPEPPRSFGIHILISCPDLFDGPIEEYSYGYADGDEASAEQAIRRWIDFDLPALLDAVSGEADRCVRLDMTVAEGTAGIAAGQWRFFLGPLFYMAGAAGAQPCCQACLFTMSYDALMPLLAKPVTSAVKIVAARQEDGATSADCRRNGEDMPDAIAAIAEAAKEWPAIEGLQLRRQYVVLRAPRPLH